VLQFARRHPIATFTVLVMVLTYAVGLPWALATTELEKALGLREEFLSLGLMRAAPTLAGWTIVLIVAGMAGLRTWLTQLLRWQVHPGYYLAAVAIVFAPFAATVAATVPVGQFWSSPDVAASRDWASLGWAYLKEIAYITATNGEETGWRLALMGLLLARMPVFPATLVVGLFWALWHAPAFFLFGQGPFWYPLIGICLAWAVLYGWLYLKSGSLLLPILAHGGANATFYSFERLFPDLYSHWERLGPMGDWIFAAVGGGLAVLVLITNRSLFFSRFNPRAGEDWAASTVRP
jgi:membrane protease YdiL (CAAX protease family)